MPDESTARELPQSELVPPKTDTATGGDVGVQALVTPGCMTTENAVKRKKVMQILIHFFTVICKS